MNTYLCMWKAMKVEVDADTTYAAQTKAVPLLQQSTRAKVKQSDVRVFLLAKDGEPVTHTADF